MPTGACGIDCDVCRLNADGICSSCGPGTSDQGRRKAEAQKRLLGAPCPILACAILNQVEYCLRDCHQFPCDTFANGPYPFGQAFLDMQHRRRQQERPEYASDGSHLETDSIYWAQAAQRDPMTLCNLTLFEPRKDRRLRFDYLAEPVVVDLEQQCLLRRDAGLWEPVRDELLELVTVLYLASVQKIYPLQKEMVGIRDLKEGHFFAGPHELKLDPLLERFGNDAPGFLKAARNLSGTILDMGDAAVCLRPFPRVCLYYILWTQDDEFPARVQVLLDRPIEDILAADAIWALINRVTQSLVAA